MYVYSYLVAYWQPEVMNVKNNEISSGCTDYGGDGLWCDVDENIKLYSNEEKAFDAAILEAEASIEDVLYVEIIRLRIDCENYIQVSKRYNFLNGNVYVYDNVNPSELYKHESPQYSAGDWVLFQDCHNAGRLKIGKIMFQAKFFGLNHGQKFKINDGVIEIDGDEPYNILYENNILSWIDTHSHVPEYDIMCCLDHDQVINILPAKYYDTICLRFEHEMISEELKLLKERCVDGG